MDNFRVTIIIANNNYAKYLGEAIDSAWKQLYKYINIVVVDDCSTDDSWSIIHNKLFKSQPHTNNIIDNIQYKSTIVKRGDYDSHIIGIKLPQQSGPSTARNIAIDNTLSFTEYYAILDADDIYYPNKVLELLTTASCSPDIGVVYGDYDILNIETATKKREYKEPFSIKRLQEECIVHSGAMISKNALINTQEPTGYYDVNLRCAEDYDLWLRISEKYMIIHVPESLSLVRVHQNNSTNSVRKEIWEKCWNIVSQKFKARHGQ